jgi:hypothetical protein
VQPSPSAVTQTNLTASSIFLLIVTTHFTNCNNSFTDNESPQQSCTQQLQPLVLPQIPTTARSIPPWGAGILMSSHDSEGDISYTLTLLIVILPLLSVIVTILLENWLLLHEFSTKFN